MCERFAREGSKRRRFSLNFPTYDCQESSPVGAVVAGDGRVRARARGVLLRGVQWTKKHSPEQRSVIFQRLYKDLWRSQEYHFFQSNHLQNQPGVLQTRRDFSAGTQSTQRGQARLGSSRNGKG